MTWEETILFIRKNNEFKELVENAYLDENLELNVIRFGKSDEFKETLQIIERYASKAKSILDIGCGNGISSINFALKNYKVTAVEPDSSITIGAGAVRNLKELYDLDNIEIFEDIAENINFRSDFFDIVYIRQAMHHANHLEKFIKECVRVLKPNGLLLTIRDHIIYDEKDKKWFLESHPLQKYYEGENAFTSNEYKNAIKKAGAQVVKEIRYFESIINYFPLSHSNINDLRYQNICKQKEKLCKKLGIFGNNWIAWQLYLLISNFKPLNEATIPGRMYSYISIKK